MGMAVSFDLPGGCPPELLDEAIAWLHHVDATFSPYIEGSEISRIGRGELSLDQVSEEVHGVLSTCEVLLADSDGVFDVWSLPSPNGTPFDPCGYVKGWSIERCANLLTAGGVTDLAINAGGDVALRGRRDGAPWRIGIRHPDDAMMLAAVLEVEGPFAVATSATYERGAHIVDPRDGLPAIGLASATVIGPDLSLADAYATTLFVLGVDGLEWVTEHEGYDGYVITRDGLTHATVGFAQHRAA